MIKLKPEIIANYPLITSYGAIILPEGTKLYHTSDNPNFKISRNRPLLFMTHHPSEFSTKKYIITLELRREVKLLFMVKEIYNNMIINSALYNYLGISNSNLMKNNYNNIKCWVPYLQNENLDGWFTSVENKGAVEVAIFSDPSILKVINTGPMMANWTIANNTTEPIQYKYWGKNYPISKESKMYLNKRFESQIKNYLERVEKTIDKPLFYILLKNAIIEYIDSPKQTIKWCRE